LKLIGNDTQKNAWVSQPPWISKRHSRI